MQVMDAFSSSSDALLTSNESPVGTKSMFDNLITENMPNASRPPISSSALPSASNTTTTTTDSSQAPPSVAAACLACRAKHLKCDGLNPCTRCQVSGDTICQYVASRRGYKGPRRGTAQNPNKRHASDSPTSTSDSCPMLLGATTVSTPVAPSMASFNPALRLAGASPGPFVAVSSSGLGSLQLYRNPYLDPIGGAMVEVNPHLQPQSMPERCIDSFYFHFFAGHPSVLPKDHLLRISKTRNLEHLLAAMRWAGSLYFEAGPIRATFYEEALRLCYAPDVPNDGFLVQALVILIICLDGGTENDKAREILSDVERIAIEIGLYQRSYSTINGQGNPILEESWRRTWWDLFVVDGMIAGVHRQTNFLLFDIVADVGLPCEEYQYETGQIPRPMFLEDFDDQIFSGEEREFSSFAYRTASIRNLGRMMRLPETGFPGDDNVDKIESLLSNWRMHLPASKRDCLTKDCKLDEMMFQAHMINHACSIILHQPHSQLDSSPTRDVTACAPHQAVQHGENFNTHTRHIITSACEISKMVTFAVPITCHTHFFTCVLTLSSIVHLSKWALYVIQNDADLREKIRLNIGALNKLSAVWKAAARAGVQVKAVAQEIYTVKKAQQGNAALWAGLSQEEIIGSISSDDSIMSEINTMLQ